MIQRQIQPEGTTWAKPARKDPPKTEPPRKDPDPNEPERRDPDPQKAPKSFQFRAEIRGNLNLWVLPIH
jgi:hypothetical protein